MELIAVGHGAPEASLTAISRVMDSKELKLGCLSLIRAACETFGVRCLPMKLVFEFANKGLRSRASIVRWKAMRVLLYIQKDLNQSMGPLILECATSEGQRKDIGNAIETKQHQGKRWIEK